MPSLIFFSVKMTQIMRTITKNKTRRRQPLAFPVIQVVFVKILLTTSAVKPDLTATMPMQPMNVKFSIFVILSPMPTAKKNSSNGALFVLMELFLIRSVNLVTVVPCNQGWEKKSIFQEIDLIDFLGEKIDFFDFSDSFTITNVFKQYQAFYAL